MARKAVVLELDGFVENVIEADDAFKADPGYVHIESDTANPGDTWNGTQFVQPAPVPVEPTKNERLRDALEAMPSTRMTAALIEWLAHDAVA